MDPIAGLDKEYQILTELYGSGEARTYLARHLSLNRDVTLTVVQAAGGDRSYLTAYAHDAELLKGQRHPNVVPVIEGRWIGPDTFAVARARVRGSTLDQLISAVGAMPPDRITAALREITTALVFARAAGVVNRFISPDGLVFQQGTGRVLVAFEPSRLVVDDAQTIRELATRMNGGAPLDVSEFIAMLGAPAVAAAAATTGATPVVPRPVTAPVGRDDAAVVVQRHGMSFGARVLTTFAVLGVLVVAAVFFWPRRVHQVPAVATAPDTSPADAAGDVALHSGRVDTAAYPQSYPTPTIVEPTPAPVPPQMQPQMQPQMPPQTQSPMPMPMPATRPPRDARPAPVDTLVRAPSGDVCDSPAESDQHSCLMTAIDRADRDLNATYQRLINALRRQAGVADSAADPPAVEDLRAAQRRWLQDRDETCRGAGTPPLYARDRAACFADRTAARTQDLQQQLAGIP